MRKLVRSICWSIASYCVRANTYVRAHHPSQIPYGPAVQLTELMSTTSAGDADKAAKASLFIRLVEARACALCWSSTVAHSAYVALRTVVDTPARCKPPTAVVWICFHALPASSTCSYHHCACTRTASRPRVVHHFYPNLKPNLDPLTQTFTLTLTLTPNDDALPVHAGAAAHAAAAGCGPRRPP